MTHFRLYYIVLALLLGASSLFAQGEKTRNFTLTDIDGNSYDLYEELGKGKAIIFDFFRYHCHACQASSPAVEQLWQDYSDKNVWVWKVDIRDNETAEQVRDFHHRFGGTMPSFIKGSNLFWYYVQSHGLQSATPGFIVILPDATVVYARAGYYDAAMRKVLNDNGFNQSVSSVDETTTLSGVRATLAPNPATTSASLTLTLETPAETTVQVYNSLGQKIQDAFNGEIEAGNTTLSLQTEGWNPGMYFVRIEMNGEVMTKRLNVVR